MVSYKKGISKIKRKNNQKISKKYKQRNQWGGDSDNRPDYNLLNNLKLITEKTYNNFESVLSKVYTPNQENYNWKDILAKFTHHHDATNTSNTNQANKTNQTNNTDKKQKKMLLQVLIMFIKHFKIPIEEQHNDTKLQENIKALDTHIDSMIDNVITNNNEEEQKNLYYGLLVLKTLNYVPTKDKFDSLEAKVKSYEEENKKEKEQEEIDKINNEINQKMLLSMQPRASAPTNFNSIPEQNTEVETHEQPSVEVLEPTRNNTVVSENEPEEVEPEKSTINNTAELAIEPAEIQPEVVEPKVEQTTKSINSLLKEYEQSGGRRTIKKNNQKKKQTRKHKGK